MSRTCLIFTCQLSAADLQTIKEILKDVTYVYTNLSAASNYSIINSTFSLNSIRQDLVEIITSSLEKDFRFNAYILKMLVIKISHFLSETQLDIAPHNLDNYDLIRKSRKKLILIFTDITEML